MSLALDHQTEQRIHEETLRGHYSEPSELINRALDLLAADQSWSDQDRAELDQSLDLAMAQIERGESISGEELRADYERRRALRAQ